MRKHFFSQPKLQTFLFQVSMVTPSGDGVYRRSQSVFAKRGYVEMHAYNELGSELNDPKKAAKLYGLNKKFTASIKPYKG